jgi:hypothetical protein
MITPIMQAIERRKRVADIFRACLTPYGRHDDVDEAQLYISDNVVVEFTGNDRRLSNAVLDTMFPRYAAPCELRHYTSLASLAGIASSQELRLYAVRKRIGQGELDTFARKHHLKGYLDSSVGEPIYKELSDDLFYTSFAGLTPKNEPGMWTEFADAGKGVRLQFRLAPGAAELRAIKYNTPVRTLLNQVNDRLAAAGEPPFVPWTTSRIGAFYLPSTLEDEDEVRLLIKRHAGGRDHAKDDGAYEYWPVPIGTDNDICRLDIIGIHLGPNAIKADVEAAIANTTFERLPLTEP